MSALIPFLTLDQPCQTAKDWVEQQLASTDFRVVQTFDLHVARLAHPDCTCPNHGTEDCNCQMIVLLVYRKQGNPATLVIHGQEGKTWLSLTIPEGRRANRRFESVIRRALRPNYSIASPSNEAAYEKNRPTV